MPNTTSQRTIRPRRTNQTEQRSLSAIRAKISTTRPLSCTTAATNERDSPFRQTTQISRDKVVTKPVRRMLTIPKSNLPAVTILDTSLRTHSYNTNTRDSPSPYQKPSANTTALSHCLYHHDTLRVYPSTSSSRPEASKTFELLHVARRSARESYSYLRNHATSVRRRSDSRETFNTSYQRMSSAPEPDLRARPSQLESDLLTCRDE